MPERTEPITVDEVETWGGFNGDDDMLQQLVDVVVDHADVVYLFVDEYPPAARWALIQQIVRLWQRHTQSLTASSEDNCEPGPNVVALQRQGVSFSFDPSRPTVSFDADIEVLLAPYLKYNAA